MYHFRWKCLFWISLSIVGLNLQDLDICDALSEVYDKECHGSETGLSRTVKSSAIRYEEYRTMYTNCTIVRTNVEIVSITDLDGDKYDFEFLQNIREVTGYVLIVWNTVSKIRLPGLRLIRGKSLFESKENDEPVQSALYVAMNTEGTSFSKGLKELQLNSLEEIMIGEVVFKGNSYLCLGENSIDWRYILTQKNARFRFSTPLGYEKQSHCSSVECSASCASVKDGNRYCWADGPNMCQKLTSVACSDCRWCSPANLCCDKECAAGCTGRLSADCLACNNFTRENQCVEDCNPQKYNRDKGEWEPRFQTKAFAYLSTCVDKCPTERLQEGMACVASCSKGNMDDGNGKCISCDGPCPRSCDGTGDMWLHGDNVHNFINCTHVKGKISIKNQTFYGHFLAPNYTTVEQLKFLSSIREIRDTLEIESVTYPNLTSLSFLGNLRVIGGQGAIGPRFIALAIRYTPLETLELKSLQEIRSGNVRVEYNRGLCFAENVDWRKLFTNKETAQINLTRNNSPSDLCIAKNRTCSDECTISGGCWGAGPDQCLSCRNYSLEGTTCVSDCDFDDRFYVNETSTGRRDCLKCPDDHYLIGREQCLPCDRSCKSCNGSQYNCTVCQDKFYRKLSVNNPAEEYHLDGNDTTSNLESNCVEKCPYGQYDLGGSNGTEGYCSFWLVAPSTLLLSSGSIGSIVGAIAFLCIILIVLLLTFWRYQKNKRDRERLVDEIPVVSFNKFKPDMSLLRLIKESELRRGNVIGAGAFGTVYKGIWIPEKENVKVAVAIKVLQESTNANMNVELLDEARIMASVCHPCCVRILAVCMTAQMMLVTQLMPLGSLLEYVRKEKSNIGSRALLLWSVQIAKGMKYLEELGIVHRDLAARNVLVQHPNQVKITDFGLAKLLDYDADAFHSDGEKMPIKWLALECIQFRKYTHKSDVWSYGVTVWEMFTYGEKPYENLQARQIPHALEKGERLPQPNICTIDVYMVLIKCWMLDTDGRPTFTDLVSEFTRMAQDPGRFLVIPGDMYLRLPSSVPDGRDLLRMISLPVDELDLQFVSADDYLRPADIDSFRGGRSPTSPNGTLPQIPEDEQYENTRSDDPGSPASDAYHLENKTKSDSKEICKLPPFGFERAQSQRYTSDPCDDEDPSHNSNKPNKPVQPMMSISEDDYLRPQSTVAPQAPIYLEVVHDQEAHPSAADENPGSGNQKDQYLDMRMEGDAIGASKDNLEYYLTPNKNEEADYLTTNGSKSAKLPSAGSIRGTSKSDIEYCNVPTKPSTPYSRMPETNI